MSNFNPQSSFSSRLDVELECLFKRHLIELKNTSNVISNLIHDVNNESGNLITQELKSELLKAVKEYNKRHTEELIKTFNSGEAFSVYFGFFDILKYSLVKGSRKFSKYFPDLMKEMLETFLADNKLPEEYVWPERFPKIYDEFEVYSVYNHFGDERGFGSSYEIRKLLSPEFKDTLELLYKKYELVHYELKRKLNKIDELIFINNTSECFTDLGTITFRDYQEVLEIIKKYC